MREKRCESHANGRPSICADGSGKQTQLRAHFLVGSLHSEQNGPISFCEWMIRITIPVGTIISPMVYRFQYIKFKFPVYLCPCSPSVSRSSHSGVTHLKCVTVTFEQSRPSHLRKLDVQEPQTSHIAADNAGLSGCAFESGEFPGVTGKCPMISAESWQLAARKPSAYTTLRSRDLQPCVTHKTTYFYIEF